MLDIVLVALRLPTTARILVPAVIVSSIFLAEQPCRAADHPNIVWITAEDMSPTLGCYGDRFATTPNIDRLAAQSVRYNNAFATAPVCSPSRSCLITGCYATSLGTCQMRSAFPIPKSIRGFPAYLRANSYFTTNNVKTDYNTGSSARIVDECWNECSDTAHWRNRNDKSQPFFSVFNLMTSHQSRSMQWPQERFRKEVQSQLRPDQIHDPDKVPLLPYYPDTMVVRRTVARFYDCVTAMDAQVGAILDQLEVDGLADDTIVFFYSDHGSGLPRHKRVLLDSGMRVPLLIRFPKKFAHVAPAQAGESVDRLVSFVDFAPTVLALADTNVPNHMQGQPFLGNTSADERQYVFGHRDRIDESIDTARSVRDKRYLYIRNYMPHLGYNERSSWPDAGEINHELYRAVNQDTKLTAAQRHFLSKRRAVEELYDCDSDPHNVDNLADSPEHQAMLAQFRTANREQLTVTRDMGFVPESRLWDLIENSTPWEVARSSVLPLGTIIESAANAGIANEENIHALLASKIPSVRYWAAVGLADQKKLSSPAALIKALDDPVPAVRIAAADALGRHGFVDAALPTLIEATTSKDLTTVLYAVRAIESLGEMARPAIAAIEAVAKRVEALQQSTQQATFELNKQQDLAMFCGFSANGFLAKLSEGDWINLFDGNSLSGWKSMADGQVNVKDGEIQLLATNGNLWLMNDRQFSDFELVAEVKMPENPYNSGIAFRCKQTENGRPSGYQCEIAESDSGMLYAIGKGWVWPNSESQKREFRKLAENAFETGKWNHLRIKCAGDNIQMWVNGIQTANVVDATFKEGAIAIQHHGKGGVHRFRNITVRKILKQNTDETKTTKPTSHSARIWKSSGSHVRSRIRLPLYP